MLVTLLQGVQKREKKMIENLISSKAINILISKNTKKTKVRNLVTLLTILIVMMKKKWYILLLKMNQIVKKIKRWDLFLMLLKMTHG